MRKAVYPRMILIDTTAIVGSINNIKRCAQTIQSTASVGFKSDVRQNSQQFIIKTTADRLIHTTNHRTKCKPCRLLRIICQITIY